MSQMTAMHIPDGASAPPDGQPLNGGAYQVQLQATADGKLLVSGISGGGGSGDASAAKQDTQIARETEIRDRIGTTTDAAPADDAAAGTLSAWLRWIARAIGTPSDAAASSGTLLAMLRALVARLPSALGGQLAPAALAVVQAPFTPIPGSTTTTTATTSSATVAVPSGATSLRVLASAAAYMTFGASGVSATTSSMPLVAGVAEAVGVPAGATHYALITATGTASVAVTGGAGG